MRDLAGKTAVITGAGSGIGRAVALELAAKGMNVVVSDLDPGAAHLVADEVESHGVSSLAVATDVGDRASVEALAIAAFKEFGAVHVLHCNAGIALLLRMESTTDDDWDLISKVNLFGVINGIQAFLPRMKAVEGERHIVATASMSGIVAFPTLGAYTATKYAVVGICETLRQELEADNIGVSVLCPGPVQTNILVNSEKQRPNPFADAMLVAGARRGHVVDALPEAGGGGDARPDRDREQRAVHLHAPRARHPRPDALRRDREGLRAAGRADLLARRARVAAKRRSPQHGDRDAHDHGRRQAPEQQLASRATRQRARRERRDERDRQDVREQRARDTAVGVDRVAAERPRRVPEHRQLEAERPERHRRAREADRPRRDQPTPIRRCRRARPGGDRALSDRRPMPATTHADQRVDEHHGRDVANDVRNMLDTGLTSTSSSIPVRSFSANHSRFGSTNVSSRPLTIMNMPATSTASPNVHPARSSTCE